MTNEHRKLVYIEQIRIIYSQTSTAVVGVSIVCALFVWMFWPVSDQAVLISWWAVSQVLLLARVIPAMRFSGRANNDRVKFWGDIYTSLAFLQGCIWGSAWIIFLPIDPVYNVVAATWVIALTAASVSAYIAHLKSLLAFFLPVVIPGLAQMIIMGGRLHIGLALIIVIYVIVVLRALLPINRSMVQAIGLNLALEEEIAERKKIESQLRELSHTDGLTGLANRRHFDELLEVELRRAHRRSEPLSLVLIDIDDFKTYNDTYGHLQGDECLKRLSRLIEGSVQRTGDVAARYGGDELALIFPDMDDDDASRITDGIRQAVFELAIAHESSSVDGCDRITISAGIATITPLRDSSPTDFIRAADEALYQAKRTGRNRTVA